MRLLSDWRRHLRAGDLPGHWRTPGVCLNPNGRRPVPRPNAAERCGQCRVHLTQLQRSRCRSRSIARRLCCIHRRTAPLHPGNEPAKSRVACSDNPRLNRPTRRKHYGHSSPLQAMKSKEVVQWDRCLDPAAAPVRHFPSKRQWFRQNDGGGLLRCAQNDGGWVASLCAE